MIPMANVTMTVEEYLELLRAAGEPSQLSGRTMPRRVKMTTETKQRLVRKGTALKGMASALKKANAKARKKNGSFKKGWTQARVMKEAHRLRRKK